MATSPTVHVESGRLDPAPAQERTLTASPQRLARIADVLYLLVIGVRTAKPPKQDGRIPAA